MNAALKRLSALNMNEKQAHSQPSDICVDPGKVTLKGPDGLVLVLTPEAAEETSDRLWAGALQARSQQRRDTLAQPELSGEPSPEAEPMLFDWPASSAPTQA